MSDRAAGWSLEGDLVSVMRRPWVHPQPCQKKKKKKKQRQNKVITQCAGATITQYSERRGRRIAMSSKPAWLSKRPCFKNEKRITSDKSWDINSYPLGVH